MRRKEHLQSWWRSQRTAPATPIPAFQFCSVQSELADFDLSSDRRKALHSRFGSRGARRSKDEAEARNPELKRRLNCSRRMAQA
jgi:hypothetical protein